MSHDRCYRLVLERQFASGLPDRVARLNRLLHAQHHAVPLGQAERLHRLCRAALPGLFAGVRVQRSEAAVDAVFFGAHLLPSGVTAPVTGDRPRCLYGDELAAAQEVLRALRPSRVPGLEPALVPHLSALRLYLRHVDASQMRWVTWVAC